MEVNGSMPLYAKRIKQGGMGWGGGGEGGGIYREGEKVKMMSWCGGNVELSPAR